MPKSATARSRNGAMRRNTPGSSSKARARGARRSRLALAVAVVIAVAVVLAGVVVLMARDGSQSGTTHASDVEVAHVHGLGVDPGDGALYAGTHHGLVRLPADGEASLVADLVQDFMGFTVMGPGHYLASGHPGPGRQGPSSLGLIESTDGGQTWQTVSLAGEADFHALEARHSLVYGLNSLTGEFMVSQDKQTWEARSQIPMADFTVSAQDPDVLVATTQQGPVISTDGGRSFELLPSAPLLQLVSWSEDGTLFGVEPGGTVHASTDDGWIWSRRGSLGGPPHAFTATRAGEIFAAVEGAILASGDGGRTFEALYKS